MSNVAVDSMEIDNQDLVRATNDIVNSIESNTSFYENGVGGKLYDAVRKALAHEGVKVLDGDDGWSYEQP